MRTIWVKVQYIQEADIPVTVSDTLSKEDAEKDVIKQIENRSPDDRIRQPQRIKWNYEIIR